MRRWVLACLLAGAGVAQACTDKSGANDAPKRGPSASPAPTTSAPTPEASASSVGIPTILARSGGGQVLTSKNDNGRTGANVGETVLDPTSVRGLVAVGSYGVDGDLYAQPLVAEKVNTPDGTKNLLIIATMNNTVYAFDADKPGSAPVWQRSDALGPAFASGNFSRHGILGTPVIDREKDRVFVVGRSCDDRGQSCRHTLASIALGSGQVMSSAILAGSSGTDTFDSNAQWQRPGLLLDKGRVYIAFGAGPTFGQHEEDYVYHGWVLGYDADTLANATAYCTTPKRKGGGIWQSGSGLAGDDDSVYFVSGNSVLSNTVRPPNEYATIPVNQEDSVVRLPLSGDAGPKQYWDDRSYTDAGNVFQFMESNDVDFGASGPLLIPNSNSLISGAKSGIVYVIDRPTMKATQPPLSAFNSIPLQPGHTLYIHSWWGNPVINGALVHWQPDTGPGFVYAWATDDKLTSFQFDARLAKLTVANTASPAPITTGGWLSLSANGKSGSGVLWATSLSPIGGAGHLWAFDATTLELLIDLDTPAYAKFTPPTIAQGKVFVATASQMIAVYGLKAN
jgi:hypothetical protein